jgi:YebC/PmpR family DNA-binding regulatory protein
VLRETVAADGGSIVTKRHEIDERRDVAVVEARAHHGSSHGKLLVRCVPRLSVAILAGKLPNFLAMGRIFEVRKHTMFARWDRMAKQFSRISKEIIVAVKAGGPDPHSNPALRRAVQNARQINMPKDKVESAIKRALGKDSTNYEQIIYEGYAPHGVAIIVEAATDNPTRTVASVRAIFSKSGGNLGSTGSVAFQFRKMGVFRLDPQGIDQDDLELYLIDHGLEEMGESTGEKGEPQIVARCLFASFGEMQEALEKRGITPVSATHEYICAAPIELPEAQANEALAMIDKLEQDEDVQNVYHSLV